MIHIVMDGFSKTYGLVEMGLTGASGYVQNTIMEPDEATNYMGVSGITANYRLQSGTTGNYRGQSGSTGNYRGQSGSTGNYENSLSKYNDLFSSFIKSSNNRNYFFEITKCCKYSEIVDVRKTGNLEDLYDNVRNIFQTNNVNLYILFDNQKYWIPPSNILIRDYLRKVDNILKPQYPIPSNIVYKIFLDEGSCCNANAHCIVHN